jgi:anti-anti-sigma factor
LVAGEDPGTILLAGELDMASAPTLASALRGVRRSLVLDLSRVTFMDVAGLRVIEEAAHRLRERGARLVTRGATGEPARLLSLAGAQYRAA